MGLIPSSISREQTRPCISSSSEVTQEQKKDVFDDFFDRFEKFETEFNSTEKGCMAHSWQDVSIQSNLAESGDGKI